MKIVNAIIAKLLSNRGTRCDGIRPRPVRSKHGPSAARHV